MSQVQQFFAIATGWLVIGGLLFGGIVGEGARRCPDTYTIRQVDMGLIVLWPAYLAAGFTIGDLPEAQKSCLRRDRE